MKSRTPNNGSSPPMVKLFAAIYRKRFLLRFMFPYPSLFMVNRCALIIELNFYLSSGLALPNSLGEKQLFSTGKRHFILTQAELF
jgi:hypothetical protein